MPESCSRRCASARRLYPQPYDPHWLRRADEQALSILGSRWHVACVFFWHSGLIPSLVMCGEERALARALNRSWSASGWVAMCEHGLIVAAVGLAAGCWARLWQNASSTIGSWTSSLHLCACQNSRGDSKAALSRPGCILHSGGLCWVACRDSCLSQVTCQGRFHH